MSNVIIAPPNLNAKAPAQRFRDGNLLPPTPPILGLNWRPPAQASYTVQGTTPDRLMLLANAEHHDWQEYVPDVPNAKNPTGGGVLVNYWDGKPAAEYTLTLRAYWALVPQSYTQVPSGEIYTLTFTTENGISTTDATTISAELGVEGEGLSAKLKAEFSTSVTVSKVITVSQSYEVIAPQGVTRVWMLWQLVDEIVALDPSGNVISTSNRKGDVDWSKHRASGAYLSYTTPALDFPSALVIAVQKDFANY